MLELLSQAAFERDVGRLDRRTAAHRRWTVVQAEYPTLDVIFGHTVAAPLRIRSTCVDWDDMPPSVELLEVDGSHLRRTPPSVGNIFHPGPHPSTGRPFVCMRGTREFHTHSSHLGERWDGYRGQSGMDLLGILDQIWRAWKRAVG
ncbi:MAG: putative metal-binding protein [Methylocystis sp.]